MSAITQKDREFEQKVMELVRERVRELIANREEIVHADDNSFMWLFVTESLGNVIAETIKEGAGHLPLKNAMAIAICSATSPLIAASKYNGLPWDELAKGELGAVDLAYGIEAIDSNNEPEWTQPISDFKLEY